MPGPNAARQPASAKRPRYCVYVQHPWGVDKIHVTLTVRDAKKAGPVARDRVVRFRRVGPADLKILDIIPVRFVNGKLVETRKPRSKRPTSVHKGDFKGARKPKPGARVTRRQTRRSK